MSRSGATRKHTRLQQCTASYLFSSMFWLFWVAESFLPCRPMEGWTFLLIEKKFTYSWRRGIKNELFSPKKWNGYSGMLWVQQINQLSPLGSLIFVELMKLRCSIFAVWFIWQEAEECPLPSTSAKRTNFRILFFFSGRNRRNNVSAKRWNVLWPAFSFCCCPVCLLVFIFWIFDATKRNMSCSQHRWWLND